jgi:segregation and condensation protein A
MSYSVKLPQFEGPLDLLLSLAQQGQVDLREIPLAVIAEEYLASSREAFDLDEATEVLWMLAAMIEMKSRLLVPKAEAPAEPLDGTPETSDLQERLAQQAAEYRTYKEVTSALRALEDYQKQIHARPRGVDSGEVVLEGVTLDDLFRAFQVVLERARTHVGEIAAEEIRVADRMEAILGLLQASPEGLAFPELFTRSGSTLEVIVTFLALLELIKQRRVRAEQPRPFAAILLMLAEAA